MDKKTRIPVLVIASILTLIVLVLAASDDVTLLTPADSAYIRGTYNFSANFSDGVTEAANVSFRYNSSGATQVVLCTDINATEDETSFSCEYATAGITDGTYSFYAYALDDDYTTELSFDESTSVTVDNLAPNVLLTIAPGFNIEPNEQITADCASSTDATSGIASYSILLTKPDSTTTTSTSSIHTFSDGDFSTPGEYTINCTVTDNSANQASSTYTVMVSSSGAKRVAAEEERAFLEENRMLLLAAGVVILIIIALIITMLVAESGRKGKKKR